MSLTVGEVKENAEYNFANASTGLGALQRDLAHQQLENYNIAIELGANDEDDWYEWEEKVKEHKS